MNATLSDWQIANQRYLMAAVTVIRRRLEQHIAPDAEKATFAQQIVTAQQAVQEAATAISAPSALEMVCTVFELSPFERDVLLLCAGMELSSAIARLCATAQGDGTRPYPTFSLALDVLPDAHWTALTPDAPLQHWQLIEVNSGIAFTLSSLRIDKRVLNYLVGVQHLDERLSSFVQPIQLSTELVSSHQQLAERITQLWSQAVGKTALPIVQLCGREGTSHRAIATTACHALNLTVNVLSADLIPAGTSELDTLIRLWEREAVLSGSVLLLDCNALEQVDSGYARSVTHLIERLNAPLIVSSPERRSISYRPVVTFEVSQPSFSEQHQVWQRALGEDISQLNGSLDLLLTQFSLSPAAIHAASAEALAIRSSPLTSALWNACRMQTRPKLDDLAQRIDPVATWKDLILPEPQMRMLQTVAAHVRQRLKVYDIWGFKTKGTRGLGISALFAGDSGTGKTLAAEVLANELQLDLYRIDLSQVVSKYIGETEKNLRRVFDVAEEGGAVLLFDEADALFGKRSEVKDSHDRYANIEVSYLLQRMEAYRGLAILTTNLKNALDTAFLRRIRFVIQFPFPDIFQRSQIWSRIFPTDTPTVGLDMNKLAQLNITGGNIRNVALNAAFLAADADEPVNMMHLIQAAQSEYAKLEKPLTDAEIGGWL